ncbi:NAD-dependent epimerase/dehydratase family protein [candidate division KSB1 bacterium]|nr:NAD-dependent epimerase/dehydratase family protein [candidate division KSB1 bacterium]
MRKQIILITGANGEMGHGLISQLAENGITNILAIDIKPLDDSLQSMCQVALTGDILDNELFDRLVSEYEILTIFHLAAVLSTRAEFTPEAAHRINVQGTINLLRLAIEQSRWQGRSVKFLFPSSIAVYGVPNLEIKARAGKVKESEFNQPTTMYGCNKLYCEVLGRYYQQHYRQLAADPEPYGVDFRSIRFPGLISAVTVPSGGTSDFAPEMIHSAAQHQPYNCFVREDTRIPFMAMPDAIKALLLLEKVDQKRLTKIAYNIGAFNPSAGEVYKIIKKIYSNSQIAFKPDLKRQKIVDSWPADVDDTAAQTDWDWKPDYDLCRAFEEYLIPTISKRYQQ